jgi:DNA repair protein RadC
MEVEGTINQAAIFPREVFGFLFSCAAAYFLIGHNHPGGSTSPSEEDWKITKKLYEIGKNIGITMVDHIIIADDNVVSLRESIRWPS